MLQQFGGGGISKCSEILMKYGTTVFSGKLFLPVGLQHQCVVFSTTEIFFHVTKRMEYRHEKIGLLKVLVWGTNFLVHPWRIGPLF